MPARRTAARDETPLDPRLARVIALLKRDPRYASVIEALAADARAGRRRAFGHGTLRVHGKIFAMVSHGRLVVKLPRPRVDAMVARGDGEPFDPGHGRRMKEWLSVTSEAVSWTALVREAHDFVAAGKPGRSVSA